ncbi:hypothetical protein AGMMS49995_10870 [Endomicrobiia bacterium]|nr:hypothetical protein AGMMS49995_10870 [Endomicrobiia bacterium]
MSGLFDSSMLCIGADMTCPEDEKHFELGAKTMSKNGFTYVYGMFDGVEILEDTDVKIKDAETNGKFVFVALTGGEGEKSVARTLYPMKQKQYGWFYALPGTFNNPSFTQP